MSVYACQILLSARLTWSLLKRRAERNDGDGAGGDARAAKAGNKPTHDEHGRRDGGTTNDGADLEDGEEDQKRPLLHVRTMLKSTDNAQQATRTLVLKYLYILPVSGCGAALFQQQHCQILVRSACGCEFGRRTFQTGTRWHTSRRRRGSGTRWLCVGWPGSRC